jgi:hypothetical protein
MMKLVLLLVAAVASAAASEVDAEVKESAALRHALRAMVTETNEATEHGPGDIDEEDPELDLLLYFDLDAHLTFHP